MSIFAVTRADGRSNQQVIIDLVRTGEAGQTYTYQEIGAALSAGTDSTYPTSRIQQAVRTALPRLRRELDRTLANLPRVGYRLALAHEHMTLATIKRRRADVQMAHGLQILQHVRWNELDENTRMAHQGQLVIVSAVVENQRALERRLRTVETVIENLKASQK